MKKALLFCILTVASAAQAAEREWACTINARYVDDVQRDRVTSLKGTFPQADSEEYFSEKTIRRSVTLSNSELELEFLIRSVADPKKDLLFLAAKVTQQGQTEALSTDLKNRFERSHKGYNDIKVKLHLPAVYDVVGEIMAGEHQEAEMQNALNSGRLAADQLRSVSVNCVTFQEVK